MREWIGAGVGALSEEAEGFVLGRGLPHSYLGEMGVGLWEPPLKGAPEEPYRARYGESGERVRGWLATPLYAPQGRMAGVSYRKWVGEKAIRKFHLSDCSCAPLFEGLNHKSLGRIWEGGDLWLVEGIFDMSMGHIVPPTDTVLACGTARVSKKQALFLRRFTGAHATIHVVFDEDQTGREKGASAADYLRHLGLSVRLVRYLGGKDPGEIWERGGKAALQYSFNM